MIDGDEMQANRELGDSHDHLLATQQRVANELARAQSDRRVGIGHLCGVLVSILRLTRSPLAGYLGRHEFSLVVRSRRGLSERAREFSALAGSEP